MSETLGNEAQQPPLPQQGSEEQPQQSYYGWQYDQDHPGPVAQQPPVAPPQPVPPPASQYQGPMPQLPPQYQQPVQDMGNSLGYGQGMEYQYYNAPQPSQPLPQLRQARLQQLREERMRRQQQRMQPAKPGIASLIQRKLTGQSVDALPPSTTRRPWGPGTSEPQVPPQLSPGTPAESSPVPSSRIPPVVQRSPSGPSIGAKVHLQPAAEPAHDTGMLQKARIGQASIILSSAFIASRVLGLLRTTMFAYIFGATSISDAYYQAFLVPDLIFTIVAGGALSSAFIPVFTQYMLGERDEKTAWHVANAALNLAVAIMMGLALFAIILAPWIVPLYNPGLSQRNPQELDLIISLSRIMFLQSIILGAGVIINSILNAKQNFLLPAIGTVLYNVGLIIGLLPGFFLVAHRTPATETTAIYFATIGVVVGAILQVAVQIPGVIKVGLRYSFTLDRHHPGVIQIGRQMVPRVINAGMLFFSTFVDRGLILLLAVGMTNLGDINGRITQYYQAFQLVLLPIGIFGMAISTAAFPTMSENVTRGRMDRVRNIIQDTLRTILFMSIPSSVGLIVLGLPIIQVLLQHGAFNLDDATSTAVPLAFFAVGLTGLASVEILTRSFYAFRDSKTPVIVSISQFVLKIALSLLLINAAGWGLQWGLGGLALSTSIAGLLEAFALLWLLQERIEGLELRNLALFTARVLLAALAMGLGLLIVRFLLDHILVTTQAQSLGFGGTLAAIIKLLIELAVGLIIYIRATRRLGIEEFWNQGPVKRLLERFRLSWL
ncbi:MAG TPA: murein biosynthesis integral membrane protein MurJ [Ktedonobacteraceae bacterium]|nr:murein biosynthesis integral membrane protein MurJ [Ktedonobacteraceae bacterium]